MQVEAELDQYAERRHGVGKALAFMQRMEQHVMDACVVDGQRARTVYDQECQLDVERTARRDAEAEAKALRTEVNRVR